VAVKADSELWPVDGFHLHQGRQRHRLSFGIANAELADILRSRAILTLRLDVDLPGATEEVEVVHKGATHKRLERPVDTTEVYALLHHLVMIDISKNLR